MKPKILVGGCVVLLLIVMGLTAPLISPFDPNKQNLTGILLQPPQWFSGEHFLGTDQFGRDTLSRIFYGARISLVIAITVASISGVMASAWRRLGYFVGKPISLIQKAGPEVVGPSHRYCSPLRSMAYRATASAF